MTLIAKAAPAVPITFCNGTAPCAASGAALLPAPASSPDIGDAIGQLLHVSSQLSEQQMRIGKSEVTQADGRRKAASEERRQALEHAADAARRAREARSSGGFFSFVTNRLGAVGLVGLATFDWGLVAADMAAHSAGFARGGTNALDLGGAMAGGPLFYLAAQGAKTLAANATGATSADVTAVVLGGALGLAIERAAAKVTPEDLERKADRLTTIEDEDVRVANKVALAVALAAVAAAGTVASGGTSTPAVVALVGIGISTSSQVLAETGALQAMVGEKAAVYVALGGAITGAALTLGGSALSMSSAADAAKESFELKKVLDVANGTIAIAEGTGTVVPGVRDLNAARYQRIADLANVDAEGARHEVQRLERLIDGILADLEDAQKAADRSTEILQSTLQTKNETVLRAAAMKV